MAGYFTDTYEDHTDVYYYGVVFSFSGEGHHLRAIEHLDKLKEAALGRAIAVKLEIVVPMYEDPTTTWMD